MSPNGNLGRTGIVKYQIETHSALPIKPAPRRPWAQKHIVEEEIVKMIENDVIAPSDSPWASPIVLVTKKNVAFDFA